MKKENEMDITFEFATHDDCLRKMVPSDLRILVAERDKLWEYIKDHVHAYIDDDTIERLMAFDEWCKLSKHNAEVRHGGPDGNE